MNYRMVLFIIGRILGAEAVLMLIPLFCALIYRESLMPFIIPMAILLGISLILTVKPPENRNMRSGDGFACVGLSWFIMSVFGALPFVISGEIPSIVDAFFETVSGFTTTGASILSNVEALSLGMNLWRCFTHWIGGMGILVFVLAIMPRSDMKSSRFMHLMRAESPGPSVEKVVPKIAKTARVMYGIYFLLTAILFVLLLFGRMSIYEAFCHAVATAGTGGFGIKNDSIASYSPYCQYVIATFMLCFGINFNVFYAVLIGQFVKALKSEELRWFVTIVAIAVGTITLSLLLSELKETLSGEQIFRYAYFQVASIISTTGFATANFGAWPSISQAILVALMFIGGCAGCTAGGIKVSRIVLLIKNAAREVKYILYPRSVHSVKLEGRTVDHETVRGTTSYFIVYFGIFALSTLAIIAAEGCDLVSGFTAVASGLNNIGPGLSLVGPSANYAWLTDFSKLLLCFDMIIGRLEIFPVLILFSPATWKKSL